MTENFFDQKLTANDRVAMYFEEISGRPMTRQEKIPLGAVIYGESLADAEGCLDWLNKRDTK